MGDETTYTYDNNGNILTKTDPKGAITSYEYDSLGRLIKETDPLGNLTTYTYDAMGNRISMTDANGNTILDEYDFNNRRTKTIDPLNGETLFLYDGKGNLLSIIDANGNITTFSYDALNRKITMTNPLGEQETYGYDNTGNLNQKTLSNGDAVTYAYDALSRLTQKSLTVGGTTSYTYDAIGNLTSLINPHSSLSFSYDNNDRLIAALTAVTSYQPETMILYTYGLNGNKLSMTDPLGGVTNYSYDARNSLATLTTPNSQTTTFTYDENDRRVSKILPNNLTSLYEYSFNGDLTSLNHTLGAATISDYSYDYDAVGNRTRMADFSGDHNYTYDMLYQLTEADHPIISTENYTYDPVGNRLSSANSSSWDYDVGNRVLDDGNFTYQYLNGCLIQKTDKSTGEVTTYSYNSGNQLIGITTPSSTIFYYYDGLDRRICKEVNGVRTYYIYDGEDILLILDNSYNPLSRFIHGPGIDEPIAMDQGGATYYYLKDGLGSIIKMVDTSGNIQQEYTYDSFGNSVDIIDILNNPYTYTSREYDSESGLYYYRARYYNPQIGRFLSPDPIGFAGGDLNLYRYVENNPVNWVDPDGLYVSGIGIGITGAITGTVSPGFSGSGSAMYVWDDKGNKGIYVSGSGGIAGGAGIVGGLQVSNLWGYDTIFDLEGAGVSFAPGAGVGAGAGLAGEISTEGITTISGVGIGGWGGAMSVGGGGKLIWYEGNPPTKGSACE